MAAQNRRSMQEQAAMERTWQGPERMRQLRPMPQGLEDLRSDRDR